MKIRVRILKTACICILVLSVLSVCLLLAAHAEKNPKIGLYFIQKGQFEVSGNIEKNEWKKTASGWFGKLFTFYTKLRLPNQRELTSSINKGFFYNMDNLNKFYAIIDCDSKISNQDSSLLINILGFSGRNEPDKLLFHRIESIYKQDTILPLIKDDFSINGKKPSRMEFNNPLEIKTGEKIKFYPCITLYFEESAKEAAPDIISQTMPDKVDNYKVTSDMDIFTKDAFSDKYNISDLSGKNEIEDEQRRINSASYSKNLQNVYRLQVSYGNTVRELWRAIQQLMLSEADRKIISYQIAGLEKEQEFYKQTLNLLERENNDLKRSLQTELLPILSLQVVAYSESSLNSDAEEEYDLLAKHISAKAKEQYMHLLNTESIRQQDNYFQLLSHQNHISDTCGKILDQFRLAIPICDLDKKKQKGLRYYVTAIYSIGFIGVLKSPGATSDKVTNPLQDNKIFFPMGLQPRDDITFCEEQDRVRLNKFFIKVEEQKKQIDNRGELWEPFWESHRNIKKNIEKNNIQKEEINKKIKLIQNTVEKVKQMNNMLNIKKIKLKSHIKNLKEKAKKKRHAYLLAMAKQELSVVAEGIGKNQNQATIDLLKNAKESAGKCFLQGIIKLAYGSDDINRREDWMLNIQNKLIEVSPLAWLRNGDNFIVMANLIYRLKIPKKSMPIRDYEAIIRKNFIECISHKSGSICKDIVQGKEWWHIGYGRFGYTYQKIQKFSTQNGGGWSLPSIADLVTIRSQESGRIAVFQEIVGSYPYWTKDMASNGDPYGYCFGNKEECKDIGTAQFKNYPHSWGLAIILVRDIRPDSPIAINTFSED